MSANMEVMIMHPAKLMPASLYMNTSNQLASLTRPVASRTNVLLLLKGIRKEVFFD
jgi:hypothetical protein